ncbi:MAG: hypothetical protein V1806_15300, partial [Pseudomonadota bacterium]
MKRYWWWLVILLCLGWAGKGYADLVSFEVASSPDTMQVAQLGQPARNAPGQPREYARADLSAGPGAIILASASPSSSSAELDGEVMTADKVVSVLKSPVAGENVVNWIYPGQKVWAGQPAGDFRAVQDVQDVGKAQAKTMGYVKASDLRPLTDAEKQHMASTAPAPVAAAKPAVPEPATKPAAAPAPVAVAKPAAPEPVGEVLTPAEVAPIMRGRGPQHPMVGWLYLDERVWAGYLQDGYYAIFDLKDKGHSESQAKGYVKAASLRKLSEEERAAMAAPAPVAKAPEPAAQPAVAPAPAPVAKAVEPKAQPAVAPAPAPVAKAAEPKAQPAVAPAPAPVAKAPEPKAQPADVPAKAGLQASAPAPVARQEKPAPAMETKPSAPTATKPSAAGVTVVAGKPPLPRPLTLAAAVAYAVENNLDAAVARQEQA